MCDVMSRLILKYGLDMLEKIERKEIKERSKIVKMEY